MQVDALMDHNRRLLSIFLIDALNWGGCKRWHMRAKPSHRAAFETFTRHQVSSHNQVICRKISTGFPFFDDSYQFVSKPLRLQCLYQSLLRSLVIIRFVTVFRKPAFNSSFCWNILKWGVLPLSWPFFGILGQVAQPQLQVCLILGFDSISQYTILT